MTTQAAAGPKGRLAVGVVLMTVGLLALLAQAGVLELAGFGRWWPLLLIGVGVVKVRQPLEDGQRASGVAFLLVGGFFELVSVLAWHNAWPLIMIAAGAFLLWRGLAYSPADSAERCGGFVTSRAAFLSEVAVFGSVKKALVSDFRGGYITAVLGGVSLDLRGARIESSPAHLDLVAVLGGIDIKIPSDWVVDGGIAPIMGGFDNKARIPLDSGAAKRLVLRGYAVMGGVSVEN